MPPSWAPPDINIMPGESCGSCYSYTFSIVTVISFENLVCSHKLEDNGRQSKAKKITTVNIKTFLGKNILMDMK